MIVIEVCDFFMSIVYFVCKYIKVRVTSFRRVFCVPPVGGWVDPGGMCNTGSTRIVRSSATEHFELQLLAVHLYL